MKIYYISNLKKSVNSVFSSGDRIVNWIAKSALAKAYDSGSGAIVHYVIGPFESDSSVVIWGWDNYPIVYTPSSELYDIIELYKN